MHRRSSRPPGLAVLDAMIARAEASCERSRAALTRVSGGTRSFAHLHCSRLQTMEKALARLKAERDEGSR
jgi:hypothetical protein